MNIHNLDEELINKMWVENLKKSIKEQVFLQHLMEERGKRTPGELSFYEKKFW